MLTFRRFLQYVAATFLALILIAAVLCAAMLPPCDGSTTWVPPCLTAKGCGA